MKRATITIISLALLLAACGDEGLLDGLGDRSREVVYGDTSTTVTVVASEGEGAPLDAVSASEVRWFNDSIEGQDIGGDLYTIQRVWARCKTSVCQASRAEIAAAIPGIRFPRLLPQQAAWITSQLVYDEASGLLATETAAQFGLWQFEPDYTPEGMGGQLGVLRVGVAEENDPRDRIIPEVVSSGLSLIWVEGDARYELFCRQAMAEEVCWQMAETMQPLGFIVPDILSG